METENRGYCTRRHHARCWCRGLEWDETGRETAEGEDEKDHFGDRDDDFAVSTRFDGFFPELHVSEKQEEEEGAKWVKEGRKAVGVDMFDDEKIIQEITLGNNGHNDHRKTSRKVKKTVSSVTEVAERNIDMTNSHFTGASMRLRM